MNGSYVLPLAALIGSIVLLLQSGHRVLAIVAVAVSGVETLLALGVVHFNLHGLSTSLVFGATLAVVGIWMYSGVHRKGSVSAATVVAFVGLLQALAALHFR
jgi:hypothetical protein